MYMPYTVYKKGGIRVRNYCGAEPARDLEPPPLVPTVGRGDRAPASNAAAGGIQAPAGAARSRFRRIHSGRTAASVPAETGAPAGGRCLAGSVPPVLVGSRGRARTTPRPHGSPGG